MKSHERFDKNHQNYVTSPVHKDSPSLSFVKTFFDNTYFDSTLDVACGAGHLSNAIAHLTDKITLLDPAKSMLKTALKAVKENHVNVEGVEAFAEALPFPDQSFDLVMTRLASHHFTSMDKFIQESYRVLKPNGYILIIDLEGFQDAKINEINHELEVLHDPTHVKSHFLSEIQDASQHAGFDEIISLSEQQEAPFGVNVNKWCEIASSPEGNKEKIINLLSNLSNTNLCQLRINKKDGEFYMPVKTFTYIAQK